MWDKAKIEIYKFLKETALVASILFFAVIVILVHSHFWPNNHGKKYVHDITDEIAYTYDSVRIGKISKEHGYIKIDSLTMELKNDIKNNSRK